MWKRIVCAGSIAFLVLMLHTPAQAQADRTFVSGLGDDINSCSRSSPCRTFAGAITKTAVGGIISVLDTSGYGQVTITKSIGIIAEGSEAGVLVVGGDGIRIAVGPDDVVYLHGVFVEATPAGSAGTGIVIASAAAVHISKCLVRGFKTGQGIRIESTSKVFVSDCTIAQNAAGVVATSPDDAEVFLDRLRLLRNHSGILGHDSHAIFALSNSVLTDNETAIDRVDGRIVSFQNNALIGNASDGQGMGSVSLK
jgi:hypothetical protein